MTTLTSLMFFKFPVIITSSMVFSNSFADNFFDFSSVENNPQLIAGRDMEDFPNSSAFCIANLTTFDKYLSSGLSIPHRGPEKGHSQLDYSESNKEKGIGLFRIQQREGHRTCNILAVYDSVCYIKSILRSIWK